MKLEPISHAKRKIRPIPSKLLGECPHLDESARVVDSDLGCCTEVGARSVIVETVFGDYSYVVNDAHIIYAQIGKFCSIASHVRINPGNHPLDRAALHHFTYRSRQFNFGEDDEDFFAWRRKSKVTLGHDVWIGHAAVIMPGVTIGTGAAVGSGAVVTKNVQPFTIVAGIPAKPIRERFSKQIQKALLQVGWWNWNHDKLQAALPDFRRLDAAEFAKKYAPDKSYTAFQK
jgi:phosphonate metabolism protein (transferase hexapeptide repeat family)